MRYSISMKILVTGSRDWLITPEEEKLSEEMSYGVDYERQSEIYKEIVRLRSSRRQLIYDVLDRHVLDQYGNHQDLVISHGNARGADSIASEWAIMNRVRQQVYRANWNKYGKSAGPIRNKLMFATEDPDLIIAFHPDIKNSKGTKHMVNYAWSRGHDNIIVFDGTVDDESNPIMRKYPEGI